MSPVHVADLTLDELKTLVLEWVRTEEDSSSENAPVITNHDAFLSLPPMSVGSIREGVRLISREEYYDDATS